MLDTVAGWTYAVVQDWAGYQPHAVCLLQDPAIIVVQVITNLGIALAYYGIPVALWLFIRGLPALPFRSVAVMFVVFILACGTSHVTKVLTLFFGGWTYWLDAAVCVVTLVASLGTGIGLLLHGRRILALTGRIIVPAR